MEQKVFESEYYSQLQNEVLQKALEYQRQNHKAYMDRIKNGIIALCEEVIKKQEIVMLPIKCVQLSLMRYSILRGQAVIRMDAYGEGGILTDSMATKEIFVQWPTVGLEEMREKLVLKAQKDSDITEAEIDVLLAKMVDLIEYAFRETLRYEWDMIKDISQLKLVDKMQDFYISVGEYMDKQEYIYVERDKVDIFLHDYQETLVYRVYSDVIYQDKKFSRLELEGSRFVNCRFENADFTECNLIDCTFVNCSFKKCIFEENDMRGCVFEHCTLYKTEYQSNHCNACSLRKGITCRPLLYKGCDMNKVTFCNCDLSYALLRDTQLKSVTVDMESVVDNSDFVDLVRIEEEEDASV